MELQTLNESGYSNHSASHQGRTQLIVLVVAVKGSESRSVMSNSLWSHGLHSPWILQARILEWVAFPFSRGSSQSMDQIQVSHIAGGFFYQLSHQGSPRILKWVAYPFSSGSSWLRNRTGVSCIIDGIFTSWAIGEALQLTYRGPSNREKKKTKQINPPPVRFLIRRAFWTFQHRNHKKHLRKFKCNPKKLCRTLITESSLEVHHVNKQRRYWLPN